MRYRIGAHTFEADNLMGAISVVKKNGWAGKLIKLGDNTTTTSTGDKNVTVTCGWGKNAHKWVTTKQEAIQHRNTCPSHRG